MPRRVMASRSRRAFVIGISDYAQWEPLNYAWRDAEAIGQRLQAMGFRVEYLLHRQATRDRIIERMGALQSLGPDDQLLIYFSGHGHTLQAGVGEQKRTLGYLVPVDADPKNSYGTAISMERLRELSGLLRARHVMFALDACFSGVLLTDKGPQGGAIGATRRCATRSRSPCASSSPRARPDRNRSDPPRCA